MKVIVDKDLCIACGFCVNTAPDVFDWGSDGKAEAKVSEVPAGKEGEAKEALEGCPTNAIKEE